MAENSFSAAPVLSTPDRRIFEDQAARTDALKLPRLSDEQLYTTYEIERTVRELRQGRWKRIALQFPDHLLVDAPRVFQELARGLKDARRRKEPAYDTSRYVPETGTDSLNEGVQHMSIAGPDLAEKLFILADTSYGACCVDEVAAEHSNSDVVVHYGRSCLSPTARLPVIYVFTKPSLDLDSLYQSFTKTYKDLKQKIILMADVPFQDHLTGIEAYLRHKGYTDIFTTSIIHNVASPLPNRTIPPKVAEDISALREYSLFHVSDPPASLLLTISSRVDSIFIYPTTLAPSGTETSSSELLAISTSSLLRRRYALLTRLSTAPVIGILVNTLSVASYMTILAHLKSLIASVGKKSYAFVVGKVNAAKVANFAEVGGWVVIGCWESSLFDSSDFWKPVVTPWELELALKQDDERVWTGQWRGDFGVLLGGENEKCENPGSTTTTEESGQVLESKEDDESNIPDDESTPPEFDLRTGRYVSHSRPMAPSKGLSNKAARSSGAQETAAQTLIKRANGDLATIGGSVSPAAEFFKSQRTWQGLGSDYEVEYDSQGKMVNREAAKMEVGRSGVARGYVVEGDDERR